MRRLLLHAAALALLGAGFAGSAQACMSFDRVAEMQLIEDAIASGDTTGTRKAELVEFREIMLDNTGYLGEHVVKYHNAATKALRLLGKDRIAMPPTDAKLRSATDTRRVAPRGCG